MYRLNYGNGQVSGTFKSYRAAKLAYDAQREYDRRYGQSSDAMWIQSYMGDGEWWGTGAKARPESEGPRS